MWYVIGQPERENGLYSQLIGEITDGEKRSSRVYSLKKADFKSRYFKPYSDGAEHISVKDFHALEPKKK